MKDRKFLIWLHERLEKVHKEPTGVDYMRKLRAVIEATPEDKETPTIVVASDVSLLDYDIVEDQDLSECTCGHEVGIRDDTMSLIIICHYCGKQTEEYLYGACSGHEVYKGIIDDWNKLVAETTV